MRAMWKGAITVGLMSITVRLFAATEDRSVRFRQVHRDDGGTISIRRRCDVCGDEVPYPDVAKGYAGEDGRLVVIDDEELLGLSAPTTRTIDVLRFVQAEEIDPILYDRTYYVEPDAVAATAYALLLKALEGTGRVAVAKMALRQVERLAAIRVRDGMLVVQTMLWPDEVRTPNVDLAVHAAAVRPPELAMTRSLVDAMTGHFDPATLTDARRAALLEFLAAKADRHAAVGSPAGDHAAGTDPESPRSGGDVAEAA